MVSKCLPDIYMHSLGFGNDRISVNSGYNGFQTKLRFVCAPKGDPKSSKNTILLQITVVSLHYQTVKFQSHTLSNPALYTMYIVNYLDVW